MSIFGRSAGKLALDPAMPWIVLVMEGPLAMPHIVFIFIHKQILNYNVLHGIRFVAPNDYGATIVFITVLGRRYR